MGACHLEANDSVFPSQKIDLVEGDCLECLKGIDSESIQLCVTSPPYFGLRDYGMDQQIGREPTAGEFVEKLVAVFREVRRILKLDGTLWLNIGDTYGEHKQLLGIPWRLAFALQDDGWILRQDIIWSKTNPMPSSVKDRCTTAHEYLFLLAKNPSYLYDRMAIAEPAIYAEQHARKKTSWGKKKAKTNKSNIENYQLLGIENNKTCLPGGMRNKRSVWEIKVKPYREAHFAVFPEELVEPCVLAASREGDMVLDPFAGSGTTGVVAKRLGRGFVGIELNPEYVEIARKRLAGVQSPIASTMLPPRSC